MTQIPQSPARDTPKAAVAQRTAHPTEKPKPEPPEEPKPTAKPVEARPKPTEKPTPPLAALARLFSGKRKESGGSGPCAGLVSSPPSVAWMVKTSPTLCTSASRCGEVQATWAARVLCYNQTVSFMDTGSGIPKGLSSDPRYDYLEYSGPHDRAFLGRKEVWQWKNMLKLHKNVDWVAAADDDTYFLVDNVMRFLKTLDPSKPIALGRRFRIPGENYLFLSGGAGYILSRAAFLKAEPVLPQCEALWGEGPSDTLAGHCWKLAGVEVADSRDDHGRERFHPFDYDLHHGMRYLPESDWYYKYSTAVPAPFHEGSDCCGAEESLTFHYMTGRMRGFVWPPKK